MTLWIDGQPYDSQDFQKLESLAQNRSDLSDLVLFLRFWHSDRDCWTIQTSGSTGPPKAISISRNQLKASAAMSLNYFQFSTKTDALLMCISSRFVGGLMVLVRADLAGLDVWVEVPSSFPLKNSGSLLTQKQWFLSVAPLQLTAISNDIQLVEASRNWRGILVGGAALTPAHIQAANQFHCPVYHSYGMTETVSHIAIAQVNQNDSLSPDVFQLLPGVQIRKNEVSCLEINAEVTHNQWLTTNDWVEILDDNSFRVLGRLDRIINSGGLKIDPDQLKRQILTGLNSPEDGFEIIGIPDAVLGEKVLLVYENNQLILSELDWFKLFKTLHGSLDSKHFPKQIESVNHLPRLENQKVDFPKLRAMILHQLNLA